MSNGNGKWTLWLAGAILTILTMWAGALTQGVIANDKDARQRDTVMSKELNEKIENAVQAQVQVNQSILVKLAEISTDIRYIKNNGRK